MRHVKFNGEVSERYPDNDADRLATRISNEGGEDVSTIACTAEYAPGSAFYGPKRSTCIACTGGIDIAAAVAQVFGS